MSRTERKQARGRGKRAGEFLFLARVGARRGGGKRVGELPCYLAKLWGGELVEEKARGRRRNGNDSREGRHHDEEEDELSTRVVSDFTGDARMGRMVGF